MNDKSKVNVVIIGAGMSGLTCASELSKYSKNINLTILEASDRIGGRVKTILTEEGIPLELGAEHMHGPIGNPIFNFACEKGIVTHITPHKDACNKRRVLHCFHKDILTSCSEDELRRAIDDWTHLLYSVHERMEDIIDAVPQSSRSVGDVFTKQIEARLSKFDEHSSYIKALKSVYASRMNAEAQHNGCDTLHDLDLELYAKFEHLEGDIQYKLPNGFSEIVNSIVEDENSGCIKLNHEVVSIEFMHRGSHSLLKITCSNREVFYADNAVVTVSVEVLKKFIKRKVFSPSLPCRKINSINKLCLGQLEKMLFKFVTPLPEDMNLILFYPSSEKEIDKYSRVLGLERVRCSEHWTIWLTRYQLNDLEKVGTAAFLLDLMRNLKLQYPALPSTDIDIGSVMISDWTKCRHYGGTWGVLKTGTTGQDIENLAEPVLYGNSDPPICLSFIGEMTNSKFYATTHAAFVSGQKEAKCIVSRYSL